MEHHLLIVSSDNRDIRTADSAAAAEGAVLAAVHTYRDALASIADKATALILCEHLLPDGTWKDLLSRILIDLAPPRFVLIADPSDRAVWGEAVHLGAYDVIAKPLDEQEARQVMSSALCRLARRAKQMAH